MFKKPFVVNQSHKVSGADRKKIRRTLEKSLPGITEEDIDAFLPTKAGDCEILKLTAPHRGILYLLDKVPLVIDTTGKNDLVPSIFALWKAPNILPKIYLKHPAVSQYVVGGADLMLPGVHIPSPPDSFTTFSKGGIVSINVPGNPCPIAVGIALLSSDQALERAAVGGRGKLVDVVQHFGDYLWQDLGQQQVPNEGFMANAVLPLGWDPAAGIMQDMEGAWGEDEDDEGAGAAAGGASASGVEADMEQLTVDGETRPSSDPAAAGSATSGAQSSPAAGTDADVAAASSSGSNTAAIPGLPEDMEALLEVVLLQALHRSLKDDELPLSGSVLWAQHMLPVRPAGTTLDIKKSKHKKMSKFLQGYGKSGLLSLREDKHSGDVIITSVNRSHALYAGYRPYRASAQQDKAQQAAGGLDAGPDAPSPSGAPSSSSSSPQALVVEEVFKPGKDTRGVFSALGLDHDALYTAAQLYEVAQSYVKAAKLEEGAPDPRTLLLDPTLCDALFKGVINPKRGEVFPTHLAKAELRERFQARCSMQCRLTRGHKQVVRKGGPPHVHISLEKRQGNKRVTRIVGIEDFLLDPDHVASECQKKFASSCSVAELPGKNQGHEVTVQGNVIEKIADFLITTYGIPKKYFSVKQ